MPNRDAKPQGRPRRTGAGYEKRDANAKWIFGIVLFLLVAGLTMHFVLAGMMERLAKEPFPTDSLAGTRRGSDVTAQTKPGPQLQIIPAADLQQFRVAEEKKLNTYGWIDRTAGVVRIPIAQAIDLVLKQGLPVRPSTNHTATGPSPLQLQQQRPQSAQPEIKEAP
jgi:hypothetical protein